jgi:hypothetical protein
MTEITIIKNVEEEFNLTIPSEFEINNGHAAKFKATASFVVSAPSFETTPTANITLSQTITAETPVVGKGEGTTPLEIVAGADDCWLKQGIMTFNKTNETLEFGNVSVNNYPTKVWIPFVVALAQGQAIVSAKLYLTASELDETTGCKVKMGCDSTVQATAPTSYTELNILTMYGKFLSVEFESWSANTQYAYDITDAVQEILDDASWTSSSTLGVLIFDNASEENIDRTSYSADYGTSGKRPKLIITHN